MWLADYITKKNRTNKNAVKGDVVGSFSDSTAVRSSGEHGTLKTAAPYGIVSASPVGEKAVVLPLEDGEVCLGVISPDSAPLEAGELMLYSKGGASVVLKNDGRVLINGEEYGS